MFARGGAHALLIAIVLGCSAVAVAQAHDNKNAARELYTEGTRLYDLNDYGKALDAFRKAYLSFEEPTLLFNIAQCQRQLHQTDEAIKTYRSFLRKVPNASNRGEVTKLIAKLEETLEKERQASKMPHKKSIRSRQSRRRQSRQSLRRLSPQWWSRRRLSSRNRRPFTKSGGSGRSSAWS